MLPLKVSFKFCIDDLSHHLKFEKASITYEKINLWWYILLQEKVYNLFQYSFLQKLSLK